MIGLLNPYVLIGAPKNMNFKNHFKQGGMKKTLEDRNILRVSNQKLENNTKIRDFPHINQGRSETMMNVINP